MSEPKDIPMLFSGPMVRALLDGRKTQTRRLNFPKGWENFAGRKIWVKETFYSWGHFVKNGKTRTGKQAWKWQEINHAMAIYEDDCPLPSKADRSKTAWHKRPSLFMPRKHSRITLEIIRTRKERLQDIYEAEAIAEGCFYTDYGRDCYHGKSIELYDPAKCPGALDTHPLRPGWMWEPTKSHRECLPSAYGAFVNLWQFVHGPGSWEKKPEVLVYEFRKVE